MIRFKIYYALIALIFFSNCSKGKKSDSTLFEKGVSFGQVDDRLHEASGLVESIANPEHLWTLNDSGNPAEVFLIDQTAKTKLVCKLAGINNRDFEDIAIGEGPDSTKNYVYVADIGDNLARYKVKLIYRFVEPTVEAEKEIIISTFDTLQITLPDGVRDSETLMLEPGSNDMYIVSKLEDSVRVYQLKYPFSNQVMIPNHVATIPYYKIVAGSFSTSGTEVLLKDYDNIYYWNNEAQLPLAKLLLQKPAILLYEREKQGESIAWARDGSGYYTLSEKVEGITGKLLFYKRR
ncbi:MAG: hypothetical protein IM574_14485 [Cytophagales bacterium]|jgi:hypothetical protein|nr:hypothetical protein [Cytophagales bacterium]MCA6386554.1 hypothetical protein [Cytophagales bacterium]MCA6389936.1 hypothetical protein [Cytophagales bacterium]MCA6395553.1 hypothetical protein [Cytophagales bacterium]MCA6400081.1 hypothetical protein [Cytophagales bacterium]